MKRILYLSGLIATLCLALASCKGNKSGETESTPDTVEQESQLAQALSTGNIKQAAAVADSLSLFVDDFTPEQTVQVLTAFISVHKDAVAKRERRRDLETLRKYVDVYDIALSVNPNDTREAFAKAKRRNPAIDFDSIAADFRSKLSQYDSMQDGSANMPEPEKADSTASVNTDTVNQPKPVEIPLEYRPAE